MQLLAVYTTVGSAAEAQVLARALVERRLAACAQITAIESVYRWEGEVQQSPEWRILFKTTAHQYPALEAAIRELHTYDLPAIYALAFERAEAGFASWVEASSQ
ncbi:MAG: divalent-cation tolerance protein CutA [Acidobacteriota bacterium]